MDIRRLEAADAPAYRALMLQAYDQEPDAFTSTAGERAALPLDWWVSRIGQGEELARALGAFHGARLVGTVAVEALRPMKTRHKAHVVGMYVAPDCRALGAGRRLMQALLDHVQAHPSIQMLTLTVTEGNAGAIRLYESLGFRAFGTEPMAIFTGDGYKAKVHMARQR